MSSHTSHRSTGGGRSGLSSNWRVKDASSIPTTTGRHSFKQAAENHVFPTSSGSLAMKDDQAAQAIFEGRRVYVGNLLYMAKEADVTTLFSEDKYTVENISISIDPFTGRNPSYCFVDLKSRQQAEQAIQELNGINILGRPVKIKPGVLKSNSTGLQLNSRWSKSSKDDVKGQCFDSWDRGGHKGQSFDRWERQDASEHWKGYALNGRRLFVGGLPRMADHYSVEKGILEFFHGFTVECVSKVIVPPTRVPRNSKKRGWDDRYVFVDFSTADEAEKAMKARDGVMSWGVRVRVNKARADCWKPDERTLWQAEQDGQLIVDQR